MTNDTLLLAGTALYCIIGMTLLVPVLITPIQRAITKYLDNPDWIFTPIGLSIIFAVYGTCNIGLILTGLANKM